MPTERQLLFACLKHSGGHVYDRSPPYEEDSQDCVRFGFAWATELWPDMAEYHDDIHLRDDTRLFSPVEAFEQAGHGLVAEEPIPGRYNAAQGWRCEHCRGGKCTAPKMGKPTSGHFWLHWVPPVPVAASARIIQATQRADDWCTDRSVEAQLERFPHTQWVALSLDLW